MTSVYRLISADDWQAAQVVGEFRGGAHDLRDGFIHFSTAEQLADTARIHYAGQPALLLLYVRTEALAPPAEWRWEASRGGALFPHLYGSLPITAVHRVEPLALDANGLHRLPDL
jgi:uncharacterized protein (DUF952 family)